MGDGSESDVIGPLINADAGRKVQSLLDDAMSRGATLLTGGKAHPLGGNFFTPTVINHTGGVKRVKTGDVQAGVTVAAGRDFGPVGRFAET